MLATSRKVAVAKAKVRGIKLTMEEQEIEEREEIPGIPHVQTEEGTLNWVRSNPNSVMQSLPKKPEKKRQPDILKGPEVKDEGGILNWGSEKIGTRCTTPPRNRPRDETPQPGNSRKFRA